MEPITKPRIDPDIFTAKRQNQWSWELVEKRFAEAFTALKRLPPGMTQGYYNLWPEIKYSKMELLMQRSPNRVSATPLDISKLEETMQWILWVDIPERKLIWKRAARVPWKVIGDEMNRGRTTLWTQYKQALSHIAQRLDDIGVPIR